jgi:hypothetical protein
MSITRLPSERLEEARDEAQRAIDDFLKNGGKITKIPEGEFTEAKDMKFKFRRPVKSKQ